MGVLDTSEWRCVVVRDTVAYPKFETKAPGGKLIVQILNDDEVVVYTDREWHSDANGNRVRDTYIVNGIAYTVDVRFTLNRETGQWCRTSGSYYSFRREDWLSHKGDGRPSMRAFKKLLHETHAECVKIVAGHHEALLEAKRARISNQIRSLEEEVERLQNKIQDKLAEMGTLEASLQS